MPLTGKQCGKKANSKNILSFNTKYFAFNILW